MLRIMTTMITSYSIVQHMYLVYFFFFFKKSVICQLTMLIQGYKFVVFMLLLCLERGAGI